MAKPRILIQMHYLELGGAETALIGLLQSLTPDKADVDLFLNDPRGEMLAYVPQWVRLLPPVPVYTMTERPLLEVVRCGFWRLAAARLLAKLACWWRWRRRGSVDSPEARGGLALACAGRWTSRVLPSLRQLGHYDLAVSFMTPHQVVLAKVDAEVKVCWIHTDCVAAGVDAALELPAWAGYDRIVGVSDDVVTRFCEVFPSLADRVVKIENILSPRFVRDRAAGPRPADMPPPGGDGLTLLTIGRYVPAKRLERVPEICRRLLAEGLLVRWYIIGYGGDDGAAIRAAIREAGVKDSVTVLGRRANPYPYIRWCDWYVQPSLYEGKAVTVREAQLLGRPVIVTDYATASSQVTDGTDGVIVPMDEAACARAMVRAMTDGALRERITAWLQTHDYGFTDEADKLTALLEEVREERRRRGAKDDLL